MYEKVDPKIWDSPKLMTERNAGAAAAVRAMEVGDVIEVPNGTCMYQAAKDNGVVVKIRLINRKFYAKRVE